MMNNNIKYPKVLIVGREAWSSNNSTLSGIFGSYPVEKLAYICIESRKPDYTYCKRHFQISEVAMIKKLLKPKVSTGTIVEESNSKHHNEHSKQNEQQEMKILHYVRTHRSFIFLFIRELLWSFNGWKSKELKSFVSEFNPDVIFNIGDPLPLMNKLQRFVIKTSGKPAVFFMMDDMYSYKTCNGLASRAYKALLRKEVKPLIHLCDSHFAISPKMKEEYDDEFGISCVILTKGILPHPLSASDIHSPIKIVYTGNLLYGRYKSVLLVAKTIEMINKTTQHKALLTIYTQTQNTEVDLNKLQIAGVCVVKNPVPYTELEKVYQESDIVLFVESLEKKYKYVARLSFSTKLTDYMASGKCIFAVGASETAPIEYLKDNDISIVCSSYEEIGEKMRSLLNHPKCILQYGKKALLFGKEHHSVKLMNERLLTELNRIVL